MTAIVAKKHHDWLLERDLTQIAWEGMEVEERRKKNDAKSKRAPVGDK